MKSADPTLDAWLTMGRIDHVLRRGEGHAPCVSFEGRHWSYNEFDAQVDAAAQALAAAGVGPGDRLALLSTPRPEYLLLLMAASRIGAVYVGLNPRHTAAEVAQAIQRVQPRLLFTLRTFEGQDFEALLVQAGALTALPPVRVFDDLSGLLAALQTLPVLPVGKADAPDAALARTAAIVFTSGTTGRPKAAMLTHQGLLLAAAVQHLRLNPPAPQRPRLLCHLPINHVGCLMNLTLGSLVGGGSVVFLQRFSAARTLQLVVDERVNCWLQVPAMFHECVLHPSFDAAALGHVHSVCIGGGAPSARVIAALRASGARLFVEYGQTETSSSGAYSDPGASDEVLTHCIGRFDPLFELRIAQRDGRDCGVGEVGEIQARGALLFAGYFGDEEGTQAAFTADGWLHTGDLAEQRTDGCVMLRGRLKEMIKSGGYNVYPREVELVLESHPAVAQVVVLGLPDERYGEAVHAVLTLREAAADRSSLDACCRALLANYKVPKTFRVIDRFPLLPNGKIDRAGTRTVAGGLATLA
jgi:acyl-CoA synthetase (AMP-forming)/AMP-acid ligase II